MKKLDFKTDRDELRPVQWKIGKYKLDTSTGAMTIPSNGLDYEDFDTVAGYFHGWFKKETNEGPETVFGLVEKEDGTMTEIRATIINFLPKTTAIERLAKESMERLSDLSLNP